ncbi:MAG: NAD(+)/NADH kinase [Chloroflexi bacterium]|nr:NAD(+)/NADH kinase [Chloroflexota bacterium]
MKRVGILYHPKNPVAGPLAQELADKMRAMESFVWLCSAWDEAKAKAEVAGTDLICSVGGDGTILRAARIAIPWPVPILGINVGRLGFITELTPQEALDQLPSFMSGDGRLEERTMLQAELLATGKGSGSTFHALNDVVMARGSASRMIYVRVTVDGKPLTTYKADGVIVATATGSTGYSLAAGGPILYPGSQDLLLKPVAAHLCANTAIALPPTAVVGLTVEADHPAILSIDGQEDLPLSDGDQIIVKRSVHVTRFLRLKPLYHFYSTLLEKLG